MVEIIILVCTIVQTLIVASQFYLAIRPTLPFTPTALKPRPKKRTRWRWPWRR